MKPHLTPQEYETAQICKHATGIMKGMCFIALMTLFNYY